MGAFLMIIMSPASAFAILPADIDDSGNIDLKDAIIALQLFSGMKVQVPVFASADVNGDGKIGVAEVIYALQSLTRVRNNHSPVLTAIGNKTVIENSLLSFTLSATGDDSNSLTYSASNLPPGAIFHPSLRNFSWIPETSQIGTYQVSFTVTDPFGSSGTEIISIRVKGFPILAIENKIVNELSPLTFAFPASDEDGFPLAFYILSMPNGATFDPISKTFSWTPHYLQAGIHEITFVVHIGERQSTQSFIVTVNNVNQRPVLNAIGDKIVTENSHLSFTLSATDIDGDSLTYSASNLPPGATFDSNTKTFS